MDTWIAALDPDPLVELLRSLGEAREAGLHEPEAMALATATPDGVVTSQRSASGVNVSGYAVIASPT